MATEQIASTEVRVSLLFSNHWQNSLTPLQPASNLNKNHLSTNHSKAFNYPKNLFDYTSFLIQRNDHFRAIAQGDHPLHNKEFNYPSPEQDIPLPIRRFYGDLSASVSALLQKSERWIKDLDAHHSAVCPYSGPGAIDPNDDQGEDGPPRPRRNSRRGR